MPENASSSVSFRPQWNLDPSAVPLPVNQFLLRVGVPVGPSQVPSDEFYITFGHLNSPAVIQSDANGGVEVLGVENGQAPVNVVGHYTISRSRLEEFRSVLNDWLGDNPPAPTGR